MGLFITFEGSEGCGKTTQVERLARRLGEGLGVRIFREPGGTALGEEIRRLLKFSAPGWSVSPEAELLLFAASRAQLVREAIAPALAAGGVVVCDRFLDSTTVYQGVARSLEPGQVADINRFAVGDLEPDITFLLDLPAAAALDRARARSLPLDRLEQEPAAFYEAVRAGYLALAGAFPERFVVLDASASADDLETAIWRQLTDRFHGLRPAHSA